LPALNKEYYATNLNNPNEHL